MLESAAGDREYHRQMNLALMESYHEAAAETAAQPSSNPALLALLEQASLPNENTCMVCKDVLAAQYVRCASCSQRACTECMANWFSICPADKEGVCPCW